MNRLTQALQNADPLRHEPSLLDADRARIRLAVLREAAAPERPALSRRRFQIAFATVTLAAVASTVWVSDRSPVLAAVRFEVYLAEEQPAPGLMVAQGPDSRLIYLHPDAVVSNDDIALSWVSEDGAVAGINVEFLASGSEKMRRATAAHIGRPMAILIDGRVVMAPTLRAPISNSARISGSFTPEEAQRIADGISPR